MDYELNVGEACACACGGARCQKGVARCEGRRFTSSRLVGGKEGEMMVLNCSGSIKDVANEDPIRSSSKTYEIEKRVELIVEEVEEL